MGLQLKSPPGEGNRQAERPEHGVLAAAQVGSIHAANGALREATGFSPATPVEEGIRRFVAWYREYYGA